MVNDEADINTTVRQVLENKGFKVDSYEDPCLAFRILSLSTMILVLIDSKMPQMNGFVFYRGVKALDKKVKTCFLTAAEVQSEHHSDDSLTSPPPPKSFIRIPIENERLLERIDEIMAEEK